jgi:spermidine/putrescine transport system permease protein
MAIYSLRPDMRGGLFTLDWTPTLRHYRTILEGEGYLPLLGTSVRVAFVVAALSTLLAYPLAYFLVFRAGKRAPLFLTLLIIPFWTSYLLRIIAWRIILRTTGLYALNSKVLLLDSFGAGEPFAIGLYRVTVIITLTYVWIPFVALPIYAGLQRIDRSLLEAAAILGSPPWRSFVKVTMPLSLPGVIAGFLMVFIPTVGEYVTPVLVGGSRSSLIGNIIQTFFGSGINWPLGSAMALIMLVGVLALTALVARLVDLRRFLE